GAEAATKVDLLAIRLGPQSFALRLAEIAGLSAAKKVTRVPGTNAAMLGIAGFRGAIVPVYDLQALLGHAGGGTPRWLVIAAATPVALAFEVFEGQRRVLLDAIVPQHSRPETRTCTPDFVQMEHSVRPIIHLPSVLGAIKT